VVLNDLGEEASVSFPPLPGTRTISFETFEKKKKRTRATIETAQRPATAYPVSCNNKKYNIIFFSTFKI
jgi:hypothetical protein